MRNDIIDTVLADDLQIGDFIEQGEVEKVEESGWDVILVTVDGFDEPIEFRWDDRVDLYGDESVEID